MVLAPISTPVARRLRHEFLAFLLREIGILPVWLSLIWPQGRRFTIYLMLAGRLYLNFGFWDVVRRRTPFPPGQHNRLIKRKVTKLGGIRSLYSESYYPEDEF